MLWAVYLLGWLQIWLGVFAEEPAADFALAAAIFACVAVHNTMKN